MRAVTKRHNGSVGGTLGAMSRRPATIFRSQTGSRHRRRLSARRSAAGTSFRISRIATSICGRATPQCCQTDF